MKLDRRRLTGLTTRRLAKALRATEALVGLDSASARMLREELARRKRRRKRNAKINAHAAGEREAGRA